MKWDTLCPVQLASQNTAYNYSCMMGLLFREKAAWNGSLPSVLLTGAGRRAA